MIERLDKVAIITGAASGIGKATTERFARDENYTVYAADKDPEIHNIFQYSAKSKVIPMVVDIGNFDTARSMVQCVAEDAHRLDVVVNAAGVMFKGRMRTLRNKDGTPTKELDEMENVNVYAPIAIMIEAATHMDKNGGGSVITITSAKYMWPDVLHSGYQDGKHFLSRFIGRARNVFQKNHNVRLVDVQPGNTKTRIDRGVWTDGNNDTEMKGADKLLSWWRNTFGAEPETVADKIYDIAEGKNKSNTVRTGIDTHLGRALYILTWPFYPYRFYILFGLSSHLVFESAKWGQLLMDRAHKLKSSQPHESAKAK